MSINADRKKFRTNLLLRISLKRTFLDEKNILFPPILTLFLILGNTLNVSLTESVMKFEREWQNKLTSENTRDEIYEKKF